MTVAVHASFDGGATWHRLRVGRRSVITGLLATRTEIRRGDTLYRKDHP